MPACTNGRPLGCYLRDVGPPHVGLGLQAVAGGRIDDGAVEAEFLLALERARLAEGLLVLTLGKVVAVAGLPVFGVPRFPVELDVAGRTVGDPFEEERQGGR